MTRAIEKQVNRVRRRLFAASMMAHLAWSWVGAIGLAAGWFVAQGLLVADAPDHLRWTVLGSLVGVATVLAVVLALRRTPSQVAAALSLDEKFGLKERATTALTLDAGSAETPVGKALLADAEGRVSGLRVGDRFPLRLPRQAALIPAAALVLLLALLWSPTFTNKAAADDDLPPADARAAIDEQMKKLAAKVPVKREKGAEVKQEDVEKIDADLEKFSRQPRETREQIKDRIREAQAIEEEIKKKQQEQADRRDAFQKQMKQIDRLKAKGRKDQKGPADKLADAVKRGDMAKAADELQRLAREQEKKEEEKERLKKKIRDKDADADEKKKAQDELDRLENENDDLRKQLEDLENQLKELTRNKEDRKKDLDDKAERGEIDKDELDREKDEIDQDAEKLTDEEKKELDELAKALKECKECKGGDAAKKLAEAAKKAGKMGNKGGDEKQMARKLAMIREVKKALCRGAGGEGVGGGRRPESKEGDFDKEEKFSPAETGKGRIEVVGDGPVGGFKGARKPEEMAEEIRQAAQEAPAAIDRQRLPPAARKMARGYFEKMRGADPKKPEGK